MQDKVFEAFLNKQSEEGLALAEASDLLDLVPLDGPPPQHYLACFYAKGLALNESDEVVEVDHCNVGIWLPDDYLRQVNVAQVLTYLGPAARPFHPNIRPPFICVHLVPGTSLADLLYTCFELWNWNLYATGDEGLNHAASQWARNQETSRFPIDRRPLKRRTLDLRMEIKDNEHNHAG